MSSTTRRAPRRGRTRIGLLAIFALALAALGVGAAGAAAHGHDGHGSPDHGGRSSDHHHGSSHHGGSPSHHPGHHGGGSPSHHPGHGHPGHGGGHPGHGGGGHPGGPPSNPEPDPLSAGPLMATIDQYGSVPNHYSGTPADWSELNTIAGQFGADGLQLGSIAYHFPRFEPTDVALSTDSRQVDSAALAPLLYSGTTGPSGIEAPLLAAANGTFTAADAAGKIVVVSQTAGGKLDPAISAAIAAGAKGLVFVTVGVADLPKKEDVNSRQGTGNFPVLLVGQKSGAQVVADATAGESGDLTLQAKLGTATDYDVWGVLPGADPSRRVFVGTPASSFVPSASERGGGIAILLGLAKHYAAEPISQRPESLVFLATTGHEVGFLGLEALIEAKGSWFTDTDAYVHMGASLGAPTGVENPDGTIAVTPVPPAGLGLHDSENPLIESGSLNAFTAAGQPLINTPMHASGGGEQVYAYQVGVPEISVNGGSLWFHTAADVPSVVDPGILTRLAAGYLGSVDAILAQPAGAVKAANTAAEGYAAASPTLADSRAPVNPVFGAAGVGGPPPEVAGPGPWQSGPGW
jgi:PA domain